MDDNVIRHAALDKPQTAFEWTVAELDERLSELRGDSDELENWLTPADPERIQAIRKRWKRLPSLYLDFLTRFSPLNVSVPIDDEDFSPHVVLLGDADLIDGQMGYSVDAKTGKPTKDWPKHCVVIGHTDGDPLVLDLSRSDDQDAPVSSATHGQGSWDFEDLADSFADFLDALADPEDVDVDNAEEKIARLTAKIRKKKDRSVLYVRRGICFAMVGANKRALKDFGKAIELGDKNARVFLCRGDAYFDLEQFEEAITDYSLSLQRKEQAVTYGNRGEAYGELDRHEEAIADFTRAIALDPDDADYSYNRGEAYWFLGDGKRCVPDFTRAIELGDGDEDWLADCLVYRGGARCNANRTDEAMKDLNQALKLHPDSDTALAFRGNTYVRMKKYRKALADYERSVTSDPDDAYNLSLLAWFLATCPDDKLRDGKRAMKLARQAVTEADGEEHLECLAAAQAETGDFANAVKTQQKAIKLCDDQEELPAFKRALKGYQARQPNRAIG